MDAAFRERVERATGERSAHKERSEESQVEILLSEASLRESLIEHFAKTRPTLTAAVR
jgi:hypothetical protein